MTRVVKLILALLVVVAAMFFLSGIDVQKPMKPIEKPVNVDQAAQ